MFVEFMGMVHVGVIGEGVTDSHGAELAFEVGRLIAASGARLICGGLGGVMEEAAKGAKTAGGMTIGILPGHNREKANSFIDVAIPTGLGEVRNSVIVRASDVLIAVGGSYGTLSEMAFALKFEKPLVALNSWHLAREGHEDAPVVYAATPEEAVRTALSLAESAAQ